MKQIKITLTCDAADIIDTAAVLDAAAGMERLFREAQLLVTNVTTNCIVGTVVGQPPEEELALEIAARHHPDKKIEAVKELRQESKGRLGLTESMSLKEAKDLIDKVWHTVPAPPF